MLPSVLWYTVVNHLVIPSKPSLTDRPNVSSVSMNRYLHALTRGDKTLTNGHRQNSCTILLRYGVLKQLPSSILVSRDFGM